MKTYKEICTYLEMITGVSMKIGHHVNYASKGLQDTSKPLYENMSFSRFTLNLLPKYLHFNDDPAKKPEYRNLYLSGVQLIEYMGPRICTQPEIYFNIYCQFVPFSTSLINDNRQVNNMDKMQFISKDCELTVDQEIILATVFDNSNKVWQSLSPTNIFNAIDIFNAVDDDNAEESPIFVKEKISRLNLFVLAAANGSIDTINLFISKKLNIEQRAILTTQNSLEPELNNKNLELTPLAAAVCMIPSLGHEKASHLIKTLIEAGANYNYQVNITWKEGRGYAGSVMVERQSKRKLLDLDKSGLLSDLVHAYTKQNKPVKFSSKGAISSTTAHDSVDPVDQLMRDNTYLKAEISRLSQAVTSLQLAVSQLQAHANINPEEQIAVSTASPSSEGGKGRGGYHDRGARGQRFHRGHHHSRGNRGANRGTSDSFEIDTKDEGASPTNSK